MFGTSPYSAHYSMSSWWNDVRMLAAPFFQLLHTTPRQNTNLCLETATVTLYKARKSIERMESPEDADTIRRHLVNAMRNMQISLAEAMAEQWDDCDTFYLEACMSFELAQDMMKQHTVAA